MVLQVLHGNKWAGLVDSLATWLTEDPPGVFETVTVVVSSRSVGRMLRQQLAESLPSAICAGVEFVTLPQWVQAAARRHGLAEDMDAWRSTRLQLAVAEALETMVTDPAFPVLAAHLGAQGSPSRRMQLADRLGSLLRSYVEWAPQMVAGWLSGNAEKATDATGSPLPHRLAWQPQLVRRVADSLAVDPVQSWKQLGLAMEAETARHRTGFFALTEVIPSHIGLMAAHGQSHDALIWQVDGTGIDDWTTALAATRSAMGTTDLSAPRVEVHGSHGPSRQVEVLRDELCHRFEADETLEPRDVLVVCPEPEAWWPHLRAAFAPVPEDPLAHPGRNLRVQLGSGSKPNEVLRMIHQLLQLADERATASAITELVLLPPVAHRWRLLNRREQVTELVAAAEVRWGLDERHRGLLGLGGVTQNTWLRGLDRLLAGLALAPEATALPITGVDTVGTSDLELVGTLSELVSRLRKFTHGAASVLSVGDWVQRVREALTDLAGPSFDDEWMLLQAHTVLADMSEHLARTDVTLSRAEFARLFHTATREVTHRPAVGNGDLQVVAIGELQHVGFRLVCLLGVGDPAAAGDADLVDLGGCSPDRRGLRQARLLAHAHAADDVLIVSQDRDEHTDEKIEEATAVTSLLREMGGTVHRVGGHPLHKHGEANFIPGARQSFDHRALHAALVLRNREPEGLLPHVRRRRDAIGLPVQKTTEEATLDELHGFLKDPARVFLQSAAAVRMLTPAQVKDELPLELGFLESWSVQDRLLRSLRAGLTPEQAATSEFQRESLPPKLIGRATLMAPMHNAMELWRAAEKDLEGKASEHRVDLSLEGIRVQDVITTHAGQVIHVVASKGIKQELLPWLQVLALAAGGVPSRAIVHRMDRQGRFDIPVRREIVAPDPDVAMKLLLEASQALQQGRSRLLPLPLDPALVYAGQLIGGSPDFRQWELPTRNWDAPWRFLPPQWELFYGDNAPSELLRDSRTSRDPVSTQHSAFGAWAEALYVPMLRGGM